MKLRFLNATKSAHAKFVLTQFYLILVTLVKLMNLKNILNLRKVVKFSKIPNLAMITMFNVIACLSNLALS